MSDMQVTETIWLDLEGPSEQRNADLADLKAVAQHWIGAYTWSKGEKQRAAYVNTHPDFLARVDRRMALCERIVEVCDAAAE